jgi:hypothetical protein
MPASGDDLEIRPATLATGMAQITVLLTNPGPSRTPSPKR